VPTNFNDMFSHFDIDPSEMDSETRPTASTWNSSDYDLAAITGHCSYTL